MLRPFVLLLLAASVAMQAHLVHRHLTRQTPPTPVETVWLPPAPLVQVLSVGYRNLVADALWLQVIQYYGGKVKADDARMPNLWPYFDAITTLDPGFTDAYFFGSFLLADDLQRPDLALHLLDRGRRHHTAVPDSDSAIHPEAWRFPYQMGFVHYFFRQDKREAARYFQLASDTPGAGPIAGRLAATLAEDVGEHEQAERLWLEIYRSATDPYTKERAARNLLRLKVSRDLLVLSKAIEGYRQEKQHWPASLEELVSSGWLGSLPLDPNQRPYAYDPLTGDVTGPDLLAG